MNKNIITLSQSVLRGYGQVMLQNNYWTGLLFIIAIAYESIWVAFVSLCCNLIAIGTAKILKYNQQRIQDGLYGFNAILVGIALIFYFEFSFFILLAIILGCIISTILMEWALNKNLPAYTFPFILITWVILFIIFNTQTGTPAFHLITNEDTPLLQNFWVEGHAFGEVMFQGSVISGIIFMIAVFINSPIAALYGIVATIISLTISHNFNEPIEQINAGLFSFNAVLCGIAASGSKPRDGIFVVLAVIISTIIDILMVDNGFMVLTFPFVFAMWIVVLIKKYIPKKYYF